MASNRDAVALLVPADPECADHIVEATVCTEARGMLSIMETMRLSAQVNVGEDRDA